MAPDELPNIRRINPMLASLLAPPKRSPTGPLSVVTPYGARAARRAHGDRGRTARPRARTGKPVRAESL
jgi:hypothetical protein